MTTSLILHTLLALLLLALPLGALYLFDRPSIRPFALAFAKGIIQLFVFSLVIWGVYKINSLWIATGWLLVMSIWAGWLVINRCKVPVKSYLFPTCGGMFTGVLLTGLWLLFTVLPIDSITVRWFVPVMAILLGHTATMQIKGVSNFVNMLQQNRSQYDFLLGNGASQWQSLIPFIRTSVLAILSPTIANLSTLALATLPLLFCGILLGGFTPINAFAAMLYMVLGCIASSILALGITIVIIKYLHVLPR
ncbi:ABC transporter permease [Prevotella sp. MA2016]|uniref:ABC transporter permease n=1 Tax=Prevotella sp. MA2016 TaxID=1408310 RepID=UPI00048F1611|nr:ABC transporter permease [Prevotella sp. MA2016]